MNLTRRFILTGLIASTAEVAIDRLMPVRSIVRPYATVWGVGWDLEVVEHVLWSPMSAMGFGSSEHIEKFREVTGFLYDVRVEPPYPNQNPHWTKRDWGDMENPTKRFDLMDGTNTDYKPLTPLPIFTLTTEERALWHRNGDDIWDPDRAVKDDEATGGNNRNDRRDPFLIDESIQQHIDATHRWEKKWQAKYPVSGMPPGDSPEWDVFHSERAKAGKLTGRKLAFKAAFG